MNVKTLWAKCTRVVLCNDYNTKWGLRISSKLFHIEERRTEFDCNIICLEWGRVDTSEIKDNKSDVGGFMFPMGCFVNGFSLRVNYQETLLLAEILSLR